MGPLLEGKDDSLIFRHGGKNEGFTNEMLAFAHKGNGVIIMANADNGRPLINEILLSISSYYNWGISEPIILDAYQSDMNQLEILVGKYKYNQEGGPIPDSGEDFIVEIDIEDGKLRMIDPNGYFNSALAQTGEMEFTEMDGGPEVIFQYTEETDSYAFVLYEMFQFDKIE